MKKQKSENVNCPYIKSGRTDVNPGCRFGKASVPERRGTRTDLRQCSRKLGFRDLDTSESCMVDKQKDVSGIQFLQNLYAKQCFLNTVSADIVFQKDVLGIQFLQGVDFVKRVC